MKGFVFASFDPDCLIEGNALTEIVVRKNNLGGFSDNGFVKLGNSETDKSKIIFNALNLFKIRKIKKVYV